MPKGFKVWQLNGQKSGAREKPPSEMVYRDEKTVLSTVPERLPTLGLLGLSFQAYKEKSGDELRNGSFHI